MWGLGRRTNESTEEGRGLEGEKADLKGVERRVGMYPGLSIVERKYIKD
jgi:hypothetical protein